MARLTYDLFVRANEITLADPNVDQATKQQVSTKKLSVTDRLEQCATSDAGNIHQGKPPGPHVRIIHKALMKLRDAAPANSGLNLDEIERESFDAMIKALKAAPPISPDELKRGSYGPSTLALVYAYKKARDIRRTAQAAVDKVVGVQTIQSLDADLNLADAKPAPAPDPQVSKPMDIFIKYSGFGKGVAPGSWDHVTDNLFQRTFVTPAYLNTHERPMIATFFGGRGSQDPTGEVVKRVKAVRRRAPKGVTVIVAFSAGGFSALNTAAKLTDLGIRIDFVGIADGAFFVEDGDVVSLSPARIKAPGRINAVKTLNTFQQLGHEVLRGKPPNVNAMGLLPGTEVHGSIAGLNDDELTEGNDDIIRALSLSSDRVIEIPMIRKHGVSDPAHIRAVAIGQGKISGVVSGLFAP